MRAESNSYGLLLGTWLLLQCADVWLRHCWLTLLGAGCLQVATAIRGAIILAKTSIVPVRRGYWGNKIGAVHTVPAKTTGKCGSVTVRLIPAPRGAGIVAARTPKKVLQMAGIEDCYTASRGSTKTLGNFVKVMRMSAKQSVQGEHIVPRQ